MPLPTNIDEYTLYIVKSDEELLEERVSPAIIQRLHRLRGLYAYWLQFPDKFERDIMQQDMALFNVGRAQAYDDVHAWCRLSSAICSRQAVTSCGGK